MKGGTVHQKEQIRFIRKDETKSPPQSTDVKDQWRRID